MTERTTNLFLFSHPVLSSHNRQNCQHMTGADSSCLAGNNGWAIVSCAVSATHAVGHWNQK